MRREPQATIEATASPIVETGHNRRPTRSMWSKDYLKDGKEAFAALDQVTGADHQRFVATFSWAQTVKYAQELDEFSDARVAKLVAELSDGRQVQVLIFLPKAKTPKRSARRQSGKSYRLLRSLQALSVVTTARDRA